MTTAITALRPCSICGITGDWPTYDTETSVPNEDLTRFTRFTHDPLCPACFHQLSAPFPERCDQEYLDGLDVEVISTYRQHLRGSSWRPRVRVARTWDRAERQGPGWCRLCCAQTTGPPWPFVHVYFDLDGITPPEQQPPPSTGRAAICLECAAILTVHADLEKADYDEHR